MSLNLEATLEYQLSRVKEMPALLDSIEGTLRVVTANIDGKKRAQANIALAREFYTRAIDEVYKSSIGEIEEVVNLALRFIFCDREFRLVINLEEKYGKSINLTLVDASLGEPVEVDLKDGTGQGVRTVISCVLHFYYLINKGAMPFLFVDEGYSAISSQYRERFFTFVKGLCKKKGGGLVLITHDVSLMAHADKTYQVSSGKIEEIKNE